MDGIIEGEVFLARLYSLSGWATVVRSVEAGAKRVAASPSESLIASASRSMICLNIKGSRLLPNERTDRPTDISSRREENERQVEEQKLACIFHVFCFES